MGMCDTNVLKLACEDLRKKAFKLKDGTIYHKFRVGNSLSAYSVEEVIRKSECSMIV